MWIFLISGTKTLPSVGKKKNIYIYIYIYAYKEVRYSVSVQINKTTTSRKVVKLEIGINPLHAVRGGREFIWQTNCCAPGRTPWLSSYLSQVGMISAVPVYL